jgi:1-acyl-sn-glycerol-3-phosphate acyltransferase
MAIDAQAPILPIVITGAASLLPKGSVRVRSGVIRLWIGEAISTQGLKHEDRFTLCDKVQQIISNRLDSQA